jgi:hypothetical protein
MTLFIDSINITILFIISVFSVLLAFLWRECFLSFFDKILDKSNNNMYIIYVTMITLIIIVLLLAIKHQILEKDEPKSKKMSELIEKYV